MSVKPATRTTGEERRRHARTDVATAIMVSPNGHENRTTVFDLSESGGADTHARVRLDGYAA